MCVCVQGFIQDFEVLGEEELQSSVLMWRGCIAHKRGGGGVWGHAQKKRKMLCDRFWGY